MNFLLLQLFHTRLHSSSSSSNNTMHAHISILPHDILCLLFSLLDLPDLLHVTAVCKSWRDSILNDEEFWKTELFKRLVHVRRFSQKLVEIKSTMEQSHYSHSVVVRPIVRASSSGIMSESGTAVEARRMQQVTVDTGANSSSSSSGGGGESGNTELLFSAYLSGTGRNEAVCHPRTQFLESVWATQNIMSGRCSVSTVASCDGWNRYNCRYIHSIRSDQTSISASWMKRTVDDYSDSCEYFGSELYRLRDGRAKGWMGCQNAIPMNNLMLRDDDAVEGLGMNRWFVCDRETAVELHELTVQPPDYVFDTSSCSVTEQVVFFCSADPHDCACTSIHWFDVRQGKQLATVPLPRTALCYCVDFANHAVYWITFKQRLKCHLIGQNAPACVSLKFPDHMHTVQLAAHAGRVAIASQRSLFLVENSAATCCSGSEPAHLRVVHSIQLPLNATSLQFHKFLPLLFAALDDGTLCCFQVESGLPLWRVCIAPRANISHLLVHMFQLVCLVDVGSLKLIDFTTSSLQPAVHAAVIPPLPKLPATPRCRPDICMEAPLPPLQDVLLPANDLIQHIANAIHPNTAAHELDISSRIIFQQGNQRLFLFFAIAPYKRVHRRTSTNLSKLRSSSSSSKPVVHSAVSSNTNSNSDDVSTKPQSVEEEVENAERCDEAQLPEPRVQLRPTHQSPLVRSSTTEWNHYSSFLLTCGGVSQEQKDQLFPWIEGSSVVSYDTFPVLTSTNSRRLDRVLMKSRAAKILHVDVLAVEGSCVLLKQVFDTETEKWKFADLDLEETRKCLQQLKAVGVKDEDMLSS